MSYDEQQARSRVVVETPSERREVVESHSVRNPDGNGISAGMVGVLVVVAIALITMLVLYWMNNNQHGCGPTTNDNGCAAACATTTGHHSTTTRTSSSGSGDHFTRNYLGRRD